MLVYVCVDLEEDTEESEEQEDFVSGLLPKLLLSLAAILAFCWFIYMVSRKMYKEIFQGNSDV